MKKLVRCNSGIQFLFGLKNNNNNDNVGKFADVDVRLHSLLDTGIAWQAEHFR